MTVIYLEKRFLKIIMGSQISFTAVGDIFMNRMLPEAGYEGLSELSELISSSEVRFANGNHDTRQGRISVSFQRRNVGHGFTLRYLTI